MNYQKQINVCWGLALMVTSFVVLGMWRESVAQRTQLEAHDGQLRLMRDGYNGLNSLHDRITQTQIEQIRLQRQLDKSQKPTGSK